MLTRVGRVLNPLALKRTIGRHVVCVAGAGTMLEPALELCRKRLWYELALVLSEVEEMVQPEWPEAEGAP